MCSACSVHLMLLIYEPVLKTILINVGLKAVEFTSSSPYAALTEEVPPESGSDGFGGLQKNFQEEKQTLKDFSSTTSKCETLLHKYTLRFPVFTSK